MARRHRWRCSIRCCTSTYTGCGANCYRIWCLLLSNMYPCLYFCRILLIFRVSTSLAEYGRIRLGYASGYVVSKISPHSCIGYTHDLTACYPILSEILDMRGYGTDMTRILHGYGRRYMNTPPPELTLNENGGNHSFLRLAPLAPDLHRHTCECMSCTPVQ